MISTKRLAIIGTTDIAVAHLNASRAAGFDVVHIAGSPQSATAPKFAKTHGIGKVWDDPLVLAADKDAWDALIIASSTESMIELVAVATKPANRCWPRSQSATHQVRLTHSYQAPKI